MIGYNETFKTEINGTAIEARRYQKTRTYDLYIGGQAVGQPVGYDSYDGTFYAGQRFATLEDLALDFDPSLAIIVEAVAVEKAVRVWDRREIESFLETNNAAVIRGILRIADLTAGVVGVRDGFGFSRYDKDKGLRARREIVAGRMSARDAFKLRPLVMKYAGQLTRIANGEIVEGPFAIAA